jgi:hypothetical protein
MESFKHFKKRLKLAVKADWLGHRIARFECQFNIPEDSNAFYVHVYLPFIDTPEDTYGTSDSHRFIADIVTIYVIKGEQTVKIVELTDDFVRQLIPLCQTIEDYQLTESEYRELKARLYPDRDQEPASRVEEYFGNVLQKILQDAGYSVTLEDPEYYFPSPTSLAYAAPAFGLGVSKELSPIDITEAYATTITYFSHKKPQHETLIQISFLDDVSDDLLINEKRILRNGLSPYGLKVLLLAMKECARNNRNPWFSLDINRCLDLLGHKKKNDGGHQIKNRKRFLEAITALTSITFNIVRRQPKHGNKDAVIRVKAPLLSITSTFEEWEAERGKPPEKEKPLRDGIQIFIHPEIYKYMEDKFTHMPNKFLTINTCKRPRAILLYTYVANQWRIGWHQYRGVIRQPMSQILDGAGLLDRLPKRKNQQREFIQKVKSDLRWLKNQIDYGIGSVEFESRGKKPLDQMVTIRMAEDHPLKANMVKKAEGWK